jgi:hypothetical protein
MRTLLLCLLLLGVSGPVLIADGDAWAGWHYSESTTFYGKQKVLSREKATIYWQGMKLRRENNDGSVEILRLDRNVYWELDPATKTYRQSALVPVAEGGDLPRELDEALAQLSPEERQLLEQYLPSRSATRQAETAKVVPGPEKETISGFECQKIQARYRNLNATLWVTKQVVIAAEEQAFYTELAKRTLYREGMEDWYLWSEALSRVGGFALKQEQLLETAAGNIKSVVLVDKLVEEPISENLFQLPNGFAMQDE